MDAVRELRQRGIANELTPDRLQDLVYLVTNDEELAALKRNDLIFAREREARNRLSDG